jgi:hypothetical protein
MNTAYQQRGASYWAVMIAILLAVLFLKGALVSWPAYWDDYMINHAIKERLKVVDEKTTPVDFKNEMAQQLQMNNIRDLKVDDIMTVSNDKGHLQVDTDYEVRREFLANVDVVMKFKQAFDQQVIKTGE